MNTSMPHILNRIMTHGSRLANGQVARTATPVSLGSAQMING
jgi:hypothetical protein